MGLHRGTKRGTIYPDRVKSLLESKWEQGFGENFLKRYFNLEGFFKKTGFFDRFASAPGAHVDIDGARNYARDEGRPLGAGLPEQATNHLRLLW